MLIVNVEANIICDGTLRNPFEDELASMILCTCSFHPPGYWIEGVTYDGKTGKIGRIKP